VATAERDYYEVLGVERQASEADIKRAFRRLARELHPDVSSAPDAERHFREVAEAYEVLSDPERRATYDRYGHAGLRTGGFRPTFTDFGSLSDIFAAFFGDDLLGGGARARSRSSRGGDVQVVVEIDLEEAFEGVSVTVPVEVAVSCERCDGRGAEPGTGTRTCSTCNGAGIVRRVSQNVFGQFVQQSACPACSGAGEALESPCVECRGEGRVARTRQLEVDIPPGIDDGQRIRVRGEGHAGLRGGDAGNAFVVVHVRPDPRFLRSGDDLHTAVRIPMTGAALGTTVQVPALGGDVELEVPPGTQPGAVRVVRGGGMPALHDSRRGDLYVRLDVAVPTQLTDEQRALLEDLARRTGPEAYAPQHDDRDEGFFQRLRSALR
jgi:molecular chaperone DnaJ